MVTVEEVRENISAAFAAIRETKAAIFDFKRDVLQKQIKGIADALARVRLPSFPEITLPSPAPSPVEPAPAPVVPTPPEQPIVTPPTTPPPFVFTGTRLEQALAVSEIFRTIISQSIRERGVPQDFVIAVMSEYLRNWNIRFPELDISDLQRLYEEQVILLTTGQPPPSLPPPQLQYNYVSTLSSGGIRIRKISNNTLETIPPNVCRSYLSSGMIDRCA